MKLSEIFEVELKDLPLKTCWIGKEKALLLDGIMNCIFFIPSEIKSSVVLPKLNTKPIETTLDSIVEIFGLSNIAELDSKLGEMFTLGNPDLEGVSVHDFDTKYTRANNVVTFIGSRETPEDVRELGIKFCTKLLQGAYILRSGGSGSADLCVDHAYWFNYYNHTLVGDMEAYLPWSYFNDFSNNQLDKELYIALDGEDAELGTKAREFVTQYHPNSGKLGRGAYSMMARNAHQVLGRNLTDITTVVVCWSLLAPNRKVLGKGGTNFALSIAKDYGVPVLNLFYPKVFEAVNAFVDDKITFEELCNVRV